MTQKHTAGPWAVMPSSNPRNGTTWRDIVSTGCEFSPSYIGEALEHDAILIARAPDLLADNDRLREINAELAAALDGARGALRKALPYLPPDGAAVYAGEWLDAIAAALNKAKGQS